MAGFWEVGGHKELVATAESVSSVPALLDCTRGHCGTDGTAKCLSRSSQLSAHHKQLEVSANGPTSVSCEAP